MPGRLATPGAAQAGHAAHRLVISAADLHQRVAVGDAAAPVGERVVGEGVGRAAVGVLARPPAERDHDDAGPHAVADAHRHGHAGAVVEHHGLVAVGEAAGRGVGGVELDERRALGRAVLGQRRVAGVEEAAVVLGRHQLQRVASPASVGVAVRALRPAARTSAAPAGPSPPDARCAARPCPTASGRRPSAERSPVLRVGHPQPAGGAAARRGRSFAPSACSISALSSSNSAGSV